MPPYRPLVDRFWEKVKKTDSCWLWNAAVDESGYGVLWTGRGRYDRAHRVAYRLLIGEIPEMFFVLHRCDVPRCVNPKHLYAGTKQQNAIDRESRGRRDVAREKHPRAKLFLEQICEIRSIKKTSGFSFSAIAKQYGVSKGHIQNIVHGRCWKPRKEVLNV